MNKEGKSSKSMQEAKKVVKRQSYNSSLISSEDKVLKIVVTFLIIFGIMMIFSASSARCIQEGANPASFAFKQIISAIIGFLCLRYFMNFDYRRLKAFSVPIAWFVVALLALVDFTPLGIEVNNAKRWMLIAGFQFQPSELAKLSVILLLSNAFCYDNVIFDKNKCLKYFLPIAVMILLIFEQPNLSMVILLLLTSVILYLSVGGSIKMLMFGMVTAIIILKYKMKSYQAGRIAIWKNPEIDPLGAGYNIIQSLIAFAAGGGAGVGFGNSKQKLFWLPESHTDFIFAVVAEEFGFIGCVLLIGLFITFVHRGLIISSNAEDMFGKLLACGITMSIAMQAFINMSVSSAMIPATGVPMPFISYGGTSLIVSMSMVGILLNISKKRLTRVRSYVYKEKTR